MRTITLIASALFAFSSMATPFTTEGGPGHSKITWTGKKVTGEHTGNISFKDMNMEFDAAGALVKADFTVDMTTITCTDLEGEMNGKLVGHLNSADFFDVENHAISTFTAKEINSVGKGMYEIMGSLTIKGQSHPLSFETKVERNGEEIIATAQVTIDRAKYDIRYGSGSFFEGLGDKMIYDEFVLDIEVHK